MATEAEARREEANQHRLEIAEMEQQRLVELRAIGDIMTIIRPRDRARDTPRLQRMMEGKDVESFLTTFERVMQAHEVPKDQWNLALASQLAGKAQQAYAAMDGELTVDYGEVKAAILRRYNITEETHSQKFRSTQKGVEELYVDLVVNLRDLASKWLWGCKTIEKVVEKIVVEQFIEGLPPALKISLEEKKLTSGAEAGLAADTYVGARRYGGYTRWPLGNISTQKHDSGVRRSELGVSGERRVVEGKVERKCYRCGGVGHFKWECPREVKPRFAGDKPQGVENPTRVVRC